jgi:hypothetical protein
MLKIETTGGETRLAGFREDAFSGRATDSAFVNRIVHNRFWDENA